MEETLWRQHLCQPLTSMEHRQCQGCCSGCSCCSAALQLGRGVVFLAGAAGIGAVPLVLCRSPARPSCQFEGRVSYPLGGFVGPGIRTIANSWHNMRVWWVWAGFTYPLRLAPSSGSVCSLCSEAVGSGVMLRSGGVGGLVLM